MGYVEDYRARLDTIRRARLLMPVSSPTNADLANLILSKTKFYNAPVVSVPEIKKDEGFLGGVKSVGQGIIDTISRPLYSSAEAVDQVFNEERILKSKSFGEFADKLIAGSFQGYAEGFSGKEKTQYGDVIRSAKKNQVFDSEEFKELTPDEQAKVKPEIEEAINKDKTLAFAGLAGDLVLDPLNLVGGGLIRSGIKAGVAGVKALRGSERLAEADRLIQPSGLDLTQVTTQGQSGQVERLALPPGPTDATGVQRANSAIIMEPYKGEIKLGKPEAFTKPPLKTVVDDDLSSKAYQKNLKDQVVEETRPLTELADMVSPGQIRAIEETPIRVLTPGQMEDVVKATGRIEDDIKKAINPGTPKYPVYNAPKQANLSNTLASAARQDIRRELPQIYKPRSSKFIPLAYAKYLNMLKHSENKLIATGKESNMPRIGNKDEGPYLRLSDVLEKLGKEHGRKAIMGPVGRVHPTTLLNAVGGDKTSLKQLRQQNKQIYEKVVKEDWSDLFVKDHALRIIEATQKAKIVLDDAADNIQAKLTDPNLSDSAKTVDVKDIKKQARREVKDLPEETKSSVGDLLRAIEAAKKPRDIVQDVLDARKNRLVSGILPVGKHNIHVQVQQARIDTVKAVLDDVAKVELPEPFKTTLAAKDPNVANMISESGIAATVLRWFKPNYGYETLRPILLQNIGFRKASAAIRAGDIKKVFDAVPEARHSEIWDSVAKNIPPVDDVIEKAALSVNKMMGNLFIESGLKDVAAGNTAMARAGISISDLNKHLRIAGIRDFEFKVRQKDWMNQEHLLEGLDILDSWRYHRTDQPAEFIFRLTQAAENVMTEYSTFANVGAIWGSRTARQGYVQVSGMHTAIDGLHLPEDIAPELAKLARGIDEFYKPLTNNNFIRMYDQVLRAWKSGVTIYAPSHHVRNMIGDMFLAWLDGVSNPKYYTRASKIILSNRNRYSDVIGSDKLPLGQLLDAGRQQQLMQEVMLQGARIPKNSDIVATAKVGRRKYKLTNSQVYQLSFQHGLLPHSNVIEDLPGSETLFESLASKGPIAKRVFQPLGGRGQRVARDVSESREHLARMAHLLHALEHPVGSVNSLEDLFRQAAGRVRKYHPDGLDLTDFEKRVMRRVFPFYSWTRKAIPLILEGIVTNPAKILAYPKIQHGIAESQGITETNLSDPFPDDQLFPDWLRGNVIGPVVPPESAFAKFFARSDEETGYTLVNPGIPSTDVMEDYFNSPKQGLINSLTPAAKIPIEMLTGRDLRTDAPIEDRTEYVDKNIPLLSTISRLTNQTVGTGLIEGGDIKDKETDAANQQALINFLIAAGILDTGRFEKSAEFDLKQRLREGR